MMKSCLRFSFAHTFKPLNRLFRLALELRVYSPERTSGISFISFVVWRIWRMNLPFYIVHMSCETFCVLVVVKRHEARGWAIRIHGISLFLQYGVDLSGCLRLIILRVYTDLLCVILGILNQLNAQAVVLRKGTDDPVAILFADYQLISNPLPVIIRIIRGSLSFINRSCDNLIDIAIFWLNQPAFLIPYQNTFSCRINGFLDLIRPIIVFT